MIYPVHLRGLAWIALALGTSCAGQPQTAKNAPGLLFPTSLGEGHGDGDESEPHGSSQPAPASSAPNSNSTRAATRGPTSSGPAVPQTAAQKPGPPPLGFAPDPEPLRLSAQWEYELEWRDSRVHVVSSQLKQLPEPRVTPRRFGRFAVELWIGRELIDRVRFDFPLLGTEQPEPPATTQPLFPKADLSAGANTRMKVLVPASPRALKLRVVDRATGATLELPFPPTS